MLVKGFWGKIDEMICRYLGMDYEEEHPEELERVGSKMMITYTSSYKRHVMKCTLNEFMQAEAHKMADRDLEKMGLATGKIIANKLVVSFQKLNMKEY